MWTRISTCSRSLNKPRPQPWGRGPRELGKESQLVVQKFERFRVWGFRFGARARLPGDELVHDLEHPPPVSAKSAAFADSADTRTW